MIETSRLFVKKEKLVRHTALEALEERRLRSRVQVIGSLEGGQIVEIVDGERRVALNRYLPERVHLIGSKDLPFGYRNITEGGSWIGQVEFDPRRSNTLKGRLALLHEMGHGIDASSPENQMRKDQHHLIDTAYKIYESIMESDEWEKNVSAEHRDERFVEEFKKRWEKENTDHQDKRFAPLRYRDLVETIKTLAERERHAWAETLLLRRRIRRDTDVDVLEEATTADIFRVVESEALGSYERIYGPLLRLAGEKDIEISKRDFLDKILDMLARLGTRI